MNRNTFMARKKQSGTLPTRVKKNRILRAKLLGIDDVKLIGEYIDNTGHRFSASLPRTHRLFRMRGRLAK